MAVMKNLTKLTRKHLQGILFRNLFYFSICLLRRYGFSASFHPNYCKAPRKKPYEFNETFPFSQKVALSNLIIFKIFEKHLPERECLKLLHLKNAATLCN